MTYSGVNIAAKRSKPRLENIQYVHGKFQSQIPGYYRQIALAIQIEYRPPRLRVFLSQYIRVNQATVSPFVASVTSTRRNYFLGLSILLGSCCKSNHFFIKKASNTRGSPEAPVYLSNPLPSRGARHALRSKSCSIFALYHFYTPLAAPFASHTSMFIKHEPAATTT